MDTSRCNLAVRSVTRQGACFPARCSRLTLCGIVDSAPPKSASTASMAAAKAPEVKLPVFALFHFCVPPNSLYPWLALKTRASWTTVGSKAVIPGPEVASTLSTANALPSTSTCAQPRSERCAFGRHFTGLCNLFDRQPNSPGHMDRQALDNYVLVAMLRALGCAARPPTLDSSTSTLVILGLPRLRDDSNSCRL